MEHFSAAPEVDSFSPAAAAAAADMQAGREEGEAMHDEAAADASQEAIIIFSTDLPEKFRLPGDPFVLPSHFKRLELSQLINQLLQQRWETEEGEDTWRHHPFDFLVDGRIFLRTSIHEYMHSHGLTPEVPLRLEYQLAVRRLCEQQLPSSRDWISSLSSLPRRGLLVEASYDGSCRVHHLPLPISAADREPYSLTSLPASSTLVEVSPSQGPLGAAAAFAGGAYMPSGCLQLLLGSKGGGYNVVHLWEEQQEQLDDGNFPEADMDTSEETTSAESDASPHQRSGTVRHINGTRSRKLPHDPGGRKRITEATLAAVGCQGSEVTCLGISNDGVTVASGGADGNVLLWDNVPDMRAASKQQRERKEHEHYHSNHGGDRPDISDASLSNNAVNGRSQYSADTGAGAGASRSKRKRVTGKVSLPSRSPSVRAKDPKLALGSHADRVTDLCFPTQPLRCALYTSAWDETICAWDTLVGGAPLSVWITSWPVTSISCSPADGTVLCSAHVDGRLRIWDIRSGGEAASVGGEASKGAGGGGAAQGSAGHSSNTNKKRDLFGASHVTLCANSRLDRRFTFGNVPDKRATTCARWCPAKEGEYWIVTVSQDGMLRLRDIRAPTMPLFTAQVCGRGRPSGHLHGEARIIKPDGEETTAVKGPPVRLLSCTWLDGHRIAAGGSDGIIRVFTVGTSSLLRH